MSTGGITDADLLARWRLAINEKTAAQSAYTDADGQLFLIDANWHHYRMMVDADENWFKDSATVTTTTQTSHRFTQALPDSYYKTLYLWRVVNGNKGYAPIPTVRPREEPSGRWGYFIEGTNLIIVYPGTVPAGDVYLHEYLVPPTDIDVTDAINSNSAPPPGHENVVYLYAAIMALGRRRIDTGPLEKEYASALASFKRGIRGRSLDERTYVPRHWEDWDLYSQ